MSNNIGLINKLFNAFKICGYMVRRELCTVIVNKFAEENIDINDKAVFENCIKTLCNSFLQQSLSKNNIEKENIDTALDVCLHAGYDSTETVFSAINAFDFPKLIYNPERKLYFSSKVKSKLLSNPESKAQLFIERYNTILQKTQRCFKQKIYSSDADKKLKLVTVDFLLTSSSVTLDHSLILGSLLQVSEGKWSLEDPTGIVQLDLTHAQYGEGFFVENSFVLVNGYYEDKLLRVSTVHLPLGEEYKDSRPVFGNLNYFGGKSSTPLRESQQLNEFMRRNTNDILFFSDVWLDHPSVFEKLEVLFEGFQSNPPIAFVFMGNFMSESHGSEMMEVLKKLFKQLGELIANYQTLVSNTNFVFVPGMADPCTPHIVPRLPLPTYVTNELSKYVPKAIFATNPCRLQYCTREITVFRADVMVKFLQGSLHKPNRENMPECLVRTIMGQGHLSPFSLNALPVHWSFDYTLRLYPLPNIVVIGDKAEAYKGSYKGCHVVNPGSFCDNGFQFTSYVPSQNVINDCQL